MTRIVEKEISNIRQFQYVQLPNLAVGPGEFERLNEIHLQETMNQLIKKSKLLEKIFHYIIKLILYRINDKYSFKPEDKKYDFFNSIKALEEIKVTDGETLQKGEFIFVHLYLKTYSSYLTSK